MLHPTEYALEIGLDYPSLVAKLTDGNPAYTAVYAACNKERNMTYTTVKLPTPAAVQFFYMRAHFATAVDITVLTVAGPVPLETNYTTLSSEERTWMLPASTAGEVLGFEVLGNCTGGESQHIHEMAAYALPCTVDMVFDLDGDDGLLCVSRGGVANAATLCAVVYVVYVVVHNSLG